jgi:hypothetical protein
MDGCTDYLHYEFSTSDVFVLGPHMAKQAIDFLKEYDCHIW